MLAYYAGVNERDGIDMPPRDGMMETDKGGIDNGEEAEAGFKGAGTGNVRDGGFPGASIDDTGEQAFKNKGDRTAAEKRSDSCRERALYARDVENNGMFRKKNKKYSNGSYEEKIIFLKRITVKCRS